MSERMLVSRLAFWRALAVRAVRRASSLVCWVRISWWRDRLFCLSADEVRSEEESSRRVSWARRVRRRSRSAVICDSSRASSSDGLGGREVEVAYWE